MKVVLGPPGVRFTVECNDDVLSARLDSFLRNAGAQDVTAVEGRYIFVREGHGGTGHGTGYFYDGAVYGFDGDIGRAEYDVVARRGEVTVARSRLSFFETFLRQVFILECYRRGNPVLHSVAVDGGGGVLLSCGRSGSGKSTLARMLGDAFDVYSDEMNVIDGGCVWGLPFRGTGIERTKRGGGRLKALALHIPGSSFIVTRVSPPAAVRLLLDNVFVPAAADGVLVRRAFERLADLVVEQGVYRITVPLDYGSVIEGFARLLNGDAEDGGTAE